MKIALHVDDFLCELFIHIKYSLFFYGYIDDCAILINLIYFDYILYHKSTNGFYTFHLLVVVLSN